MTAEQIHDALTLLPSDLIAEADRKRREKPRAIPWKRYAAMAACFVLVLGCSTFALLLFSAGGAKEAAPEAPMMQAAPESNERAQDAALSEEATEKEPLCGLPTAPASGNSAASDSAVTSEYSCIDHAHHPAEPLEDTENSTGWCGNLTATVYIGENAYPLSGGDAVTLTDILYRLEYAPENLCRCMAEFTVDTEMGTGYEISLTECFVRFDGGQASLTEAQARQIQSILDTLGN